MSPGVMICIPSFIKIGSGVQKLIKEYTNTQTACFYFFSFKIMNVN
jgi:hypothetical protein